MFATVLVIMVVLSFAWIYVEVTSQQSSDNSGESLEKSHMIV